MEEYKEISKSTSPCPFCKSKDVRYSVSTADKKAHYYYSQCYCNTCKACGPRVRFIPEGLIKNRYAAENDKTAKNTAIYFWNMREGKSNAENN